MGVVSVGSLLRARTRDPDGNEVGTFNAQTRPTDTQVGDLLAVAVGDLASDTGLEIPEAFWVQAGNVATYKAAMLVELSYFPEQVAAGRSPYEQIRELYLEALASLKTALTATGAVLPGEAALLPDPPSYSFPLESTLDHILGPVPGGYRTTPETSSGGQPLQGVLTHLQGVLWYG